MNVRTVLFVAACAGVCAACSLAAATPSVTLAEKDMAWTGGTARLARAGKTPAAPVPLERHKGSSSHLRIDLPKSLMKEFDALEKDPGYVSQLPEECLRQNKEEGLPKEFEGLR